jgi:hypothetical protein
MRNEIRHSRSIDESVSKEGKAAILWFKKYWIEKNLIRNTGDGSSFEGFPILEINIGFSYLK